MPPSCTEEAIAIPTVDGAVIAGRLFSPGGRPRGAVIILPCVGSTQARYEEFARFLCDSNWIVVTFDYRGVGESRDVRPRTQNTMSQWGTHDFDGVIAWVVERLAPGRLVAVGHSIGGQLIPLAARAHVLDAAVCVAAQRGHWRHWRGFQRLLLQVLWYFYIPISAGLLGRVHLPSGREPLDPRVAMEWSLWGRFDDYRTDRGTSHRALFAALDIPMLFLSFSDDTLFAPKRAVDALARDYFVSARRLRCHIEPALLGLPVIGHSGFFSAKRCPRAWWSDVSNWMANARAQDYPPCSLTEWRPSELSILGRS